MYVFKCILLELDNTMDWCISGFSRLVFLLGEIDWKYLPYFCILEVILMH